MIDLQRGLRQLAGRAKTSRATKVVVVSQDDHDAQLANAIRNKNEEFLVYTLLKMCNMEVRPRKCPARPFRLGV